GNVRWLIAIARDPNRMAAERRRAIQHAYRAGASVADLVKIYDDTTDPQLKESVMNQLVESGEKTATDKLMQIAKADDSPTMRRRAVNVLSRSSDERIKKFLSDLVER